MMALALAYVFASPATFDVNVQFDGYIPIFGGKTGKANVDLTVIANPKSADTVECSISEIKAIAFGAELPLNASNVEQFFPKSEVQFKPNGTVVKNSAPAIKMPARLPGLDSQRLPEISFLPLILPPENQEKYSFKRAFSGREVEYTVNLVQPVGANIALKFQLKSESNGFEGAFGRELEDEKGAKARTNSLLIGNGSATFNVKAGQFDYVEVSSVETTTVTPIGKGEPTKRELKTKLTIKRRTS